LREHYRLTPPRGIGLSQTIRRDYDAYRTEYDHLVASLFEPTQLHVQEILEAAAVKAKVAIDRRLRFERALTDFVAAARKNSQTESQGAREAADDVRERVGELARVSIRDVERTVSDVLTRAARLDVSKLDDEAFVSQRTALESELARASEEELRTLGAIAEQLRSISSHLQNFPNGDTSPAELTEALEEEVIALRERSEADLELAQLGMAIQVVNHEFDATIRAVRRNIRELRAWADSNESIRKLYESIRDNFSHLDGYLALFTPLQRRLYRSAVRITGADILKFLEDLFEDRLNRHSVSLQATTAFKRHALMGYPSTFYPVFVNLVDNAIYWVARRQGPRIIRLNASDGALTVSDSGSGVAERDRDVIFDLGFTRKPSGRGLGLHISKDVLARANYRLSLAAGPGELGGATFEISPIVVQQLETEGAGDEK
jgi:signal transduction histidine kinase